MSTLRSLGWRLELTHAPHLDHENAGGQPIRVFAVNLVAPQGSVDGDSPWPSLAASAEVAIGAEAAKIEMGDWLWPWRWTVESWKFCAWDAAANGWRELSTATFVRGVDAIDYSQRAKLQTAFVQEVSDSIVGCELAFSLDDRWNGTAAANNSIVMEKSLVHALAPTTHAAAVLSNDVFRMAGFLSSADTIANGGVLAALPVLTVDTVTYVPGSPQGDKEFCFAKYAPTLSSGADVYFGCASANVGAGQEPVPFEVTRGAALSMGLEGLVLGIASPLQLVQRWLMELTRAPHVEEWIGDAIYARNWEAAYPVALRHVLVRSLGAGWLQAYRPGVDEGTHCLDFVAQQDSINACRDVFPNTQQMGRHFGLLQPIAWADTADALAEWSEALRAAVEQKTDSTDAIEQYRASKRAIEELGTKIDPLPEEASDGDKRRRRKQVADFIGAWLVLYDAVTGARRQDAYRVWLASRVRKIGSGEKEDKAKVIGALGAVLTDDAVDQCLAAMVQYEDEAIALFGAIGKLDDLESSFDDDLTADEIMELGEKEKELCDRIANGIAAMTARWIEKAGGQDPWQAPDTVVTAMRESLLASVRRQARSNGRAETDQGLALRFELPVQAQEQQRRDEDARIRGSAIVLQGGVIENKTFKPSSLPIWITRCGVRCYSANQPSNRLQRQENARLADTHGVVGSVILGARRLTQIEYSGEPLAARERDDDGHLAAGDDAGDSDGIRALDYRWFSASQDWDQVPLGFGMAYRGLATQIDNAGGVVAKALRAASQWADPCKVSEKTLDDHCKSIIPYRSMTPPGAPRLLSVHAGRVRGNAKSLLVSHIDPRELGPEARATVWVRERLAGIARLNNGNPEVTRNLQIREIAAGAAVPTVYCLAHDQKLEPGNVPLWLEDAPSAIELTYSVPLCPVLFVRRWLATDQAILKTNANQNLLSDDVFANNEEALKKFADQFAIEHQLRDPQGVAYHPAVTAFGIEVTAFEPDGTRSGSETRLVERVRLKPHKVPFMLNDQALRIRVHTSTHQPFSVEIKTLDDAEIVLPPGWFARIRVYSLVEDRFFLPVDHHAENPVASSLHRFGKSLRASSPLFSQGVKPFHHFGPAETWVEALPQWPNQFKEGDAGVLSVRGPGDVVTGERDFGPEATQLWLEIERTQCPADWVARAKVQRHAWHWVGYATQFPPLTAASKLDLWLPSFAGVESHREFLDYGCPTYFDAQGWAVGAPSQTAGAAPNMLQIHRHELRADVRPATYAAYSLRLELRFQRWLHPASRAAKAGPASVERRILAAGNVVKGLGDFSEEARLPAPQMTFALPLTATYEYAPDGGGGVPLNAERPGNLLIFDLALMRTDRFASDGGLGDTLEIDLMQTRSIQFGSKQVSIPHVGPAPIYHASPSREFDPNQEPLALPDWRVDVQPAHGLTYDLSRNAKVNQTAVVVLPQLRDRNSDSNAEHVEGQWLLAQVRARRVIQPETLLNATIHNTLAWRRVGVQRVPRDFAIEFNEVSASVLIQLHVIYGGISQTKNTYKIQLHEKDLDRWRRKRIRLLVSFHWGRWKGAALSWAPQVQIQTPRGVAEFGWITAATLPCSSFANDPWTHSDGELQLEVDGQPTKMHIVSMSDYTEPRWLLFIGRIPGTSRARADEYVLRPDAKAKTLKLQNGLRFGALPPPPKGAKDWGRDRVTFYLLFVRSPLGDVLAGEVNRAAVVDLKVFKPIIGNDDSVSEFQLLDEKDSFDSMEGATATLVGFQQVNAPTEAERSLEVKTFQDVLDWIFPAQAAQSTEALFRPNGQVWDGMVVRSAQSE